MKWLAKLFYRGRVRRLERTQRAAALLAAGRIDEAEQLLDLARPTRWVDDLAVFHFVTGKLHMERGALDEAERHLYTALGLGLDRPSVKLNLAVLKVRRCDLASALSLLSDVELSDDESILEQVRVMRRVIAEVTSGALLGELAERGQRFRKKHLEKELGDDDLAGTLRALGEVIKGSKLSSRDLEDALLLMGQLAVASRGGSWLLGLEPRDHRVLVDGVAWQPWAEVERLRAGEIDALSLPGDPKAGPGEALLGSTRGDVSNNS